DGRRAAPAAAVADLATPELSEPERVVVECRARAGHSQFCHLHAGVCRPPRGAPATTGATEPVATRNGAGESWHHDRCAASLPRLFGHPADRQRGQADLQRDAAQPEAAAEPRTAVWCGIHLVEEPGLRLGPELSAAGLLQP